MPDILHEIGMFQFENLVRNQIPFTLVNVNDCDLKSLFPVYLSAPLERRQLKTTVERAVSDVKENVPIKDQAIVVLCEDGSKSGRIVDELENAGFRNVFYVKGGRHALTATN